MFFRQKETTTKTARWRAERWHGARCASLFLMVVGLVIVDAGAPAFAEGGQKNDSWALPSDPQTQQRPIVNGHHVQPRPADFDHPEFTPSQSNEVDELYREIQQMRHSEAAEARRVLRGGRD